MTEPSYAKYAAEFVGTFALVFTIGCNVLTGQPVWGGVSIACVLTVMIYALGKSSGANFNPAVSVALGMSKKMPWKEVGIYSAVQITAGLLAGMAYSVLFDKTTSLAPTKGHSMVQAGMAEVIYTFMLCFVVLNVAASKMHGGKNQFYGLAIGFVIVAGAYSGGSISMGCFNPAVAFGLDVSSSLSGIKNVAAYTIFELIGAAGAAMLFGICRPEEIEEGAQPPASYPLQSRLVSEFLGTYMLVLTVGLNVLSKSPAAVFSIASSLMCMIFALGSCSGAHFNPAVTTAIVLSGRGKCDAKDGAYYAITQIVAGIIAAFSYSMLNNGDKFGLKPEGSNWTQIITAELIFTFVLAFVVLSVATVKNPLSEYFGFVIGMCVTAGGYAIGKISGGSLNPAVTVGIASFSALDGRLTNAIIYCMAELAAGALAATAFKVTQPSEYGEKLGQGEASYGTA
jgi:aquaporin Z